MNTINNPFICVFLPFALAAYEAYIAAGVVITGVGYLVYKLTSGSSSHIHSKLKHIKNKVKVPRKIKNPNSSVRYYINKGKKGNRHKLHVVSKVTRSISTVKYYSSNNKRSNSNLKLSKSKVAQIVYQDAYDTYLSTKNRERAKIGEHSEYSIRYQEKQIFKHLNAAGDGGNITKQHSLDNILTYSRNLPKFSQKAMSKGQYLIKTGLKLNSPKLVAKGMGYVSVSFLSSAELVSIVVRYSPFIGILVISKLNDR